MNEELLFAAASAMRPGSERNAFLEKECAGNHELRARLQQLLDAHDSGTGMLDRDDVERTVIRPPDPADAPAAPQVGGIVAGRYKLLEQIGEGGMGTVWVAEQTQPVRRKVALKLIKVGMDSRSVIARFEAERQALALMDHTNIARVLDAGTASDGRPYFAMEPVKGVPITEFCDARKLSSRERLQLFVPVCQAIQHAHQKGIIHRDIKPSNVLVALHDELPVPKVIDFGVAKAVGQQLTEKTLYTGFGALVGTPAYMAPEQATFNQLDVDTRADVYALGVLLYELLVGSPPFEPERLKKAALDEVLRLVREEEPPRPSARLSTSQARASIAAVRQSDPDKLTKLVRGELDWIVMKALEKDRNRRYETANGFAADIRRYLSGEPVLAVPASSWYRLRKFARRNRGMLSTATAFVGLLVLATVVSVWLAVWARRAEYDAQTNRSDAVEQATRALDNLDKYQGALKETEKRAAENLRLAAAAEVARRDSVTMLADMQTERGFQSARSGDSSTAALWFANAATLTPFDLGRQSASRMRVKNWLKDSIVPMSLLKFPNPGPRRLAFQPDGPLFLALGGGRLSLWNWRYEQPLEWAEVLVDISDASWSPDGTLLAIAAADGDVHFRDPATGAVLLRLPKLERVAVIRWSPEGQRIAVAGSRLQIWNVASDPILAFDLEHPSLVDGLSFSRTGNRLATAGSDGMARVFAVDGGATNTSPLFAPVEHVPSPTAQRLIEPVFCDSDRKLVTFLRTQQPAWWNAETGESIAPAWKSETPGCNRSLAVSTDGNWVAAAGNEACLLWSVDGQSFLLPHTNHVQSVSFRSDSMSLMTTCFDGRARVWSVPPITATPSSLPQMETFAECVLSPDGEMAATVGERQVIIWQFPRHEETVGQIRGWTGFNWIPRPSVDGRLVTPGAWHETPWGMIARGDTLAVALMANGQPAGPTIALTGNLYDSCVCSDNTTVAAACIAGNSGSLSMYDTASGKLVCQPIELPDLPVSVAARPRMPQVAVLCRDGRLQILSTKDGSRLCDLRHSDWIAGWPHSRVVYSPDGNTLVTVSPNNIVSIREADDGELRCPPLKPVIGIGPCRTIAISPDSRWLATAVNGENVVQVWNLQTGGPAGPALPHPGDLYGIFSIAFSPDGLQILSGHKDGNLRLWNWKTGQLASPLLVHPDEVLSVAFTPDGNFALAAVRASGLHVWDLSNGKLIAPPAGPLPPATATRVVARDSITGPMATASHYAVITSDGFSVIDVSKILSDSDDASALLCHAELVTNRKLHAGELAPLEQNEWDERWHAYVASRMTVEDAASALASALDMVTDATSRTTIAKRALQINVLPRLLSLRPGIPELHAEAARGAIRRKDPAASERHRTLAIDAFEKLLGKQSLDFAGASAWADLLIEEREASDWVPLEPIELTSKSGCTFDVLPDRSILAGATPSGGRNDLYSFRSRIPVRKLSQLRLEALPHPDLPNGGPGWGQGNFVLTELRATLQQKDGMAVPLRFHDVLADMVRPLDWDTTLLDGPWGAIDDNLATRWDIWPSPGKAHWLKLKLEAPIENHDGDELIVELDFRRPMTGYFRLGCFRLSVSDDQEDYLVDGLTSPTSRREQSGIVSLAAAYLAIGKPALANAVLNSAKDSVAPGELCLRLLLLARSQQESGNVEGARATCADILAWLQRETPPRTLLNAVHNVLSRSTGLSRPEFNSLIANVVIERDLLRLTAEIDRDQSSASQFSARGQFLARLGRWRQSAEDYAKALALDPNDQEVWINMATSQILAGEVTKHRDLCRMLAAQIRDSDNLFRAEAVVRVCLLTPDSVDLGTLPLQMIKDATAKPEYKRYRPWFISLSGLAAYREGRYEEAIEWTGKLTDVSEDFGGGLSTLTRAMAEYKLGRHDQARGTLDRVEGLIPVELRPLGTEGYRGPLPAASSVVFRDWVGGEILRREAAMMIQPAEEEGKP